MLDLCCIHGLEVAPATMIFKSARAQQAVCKDSKTDGSSPLRGSS